MVYPADMHTCKGLEVHTVSGDQVLLGCREVRFGLCFITCFPVPEIDSLNSRYIQQMAHTEK